MIVRLVQGIQEECLKIAVCNVRLLQQVREEC
jgi:hypothetical protein